MSIEDTVNLSSSGSHYQSYGFLEPTQLGLMAGQTQSRVARSSSHYQDAHTLDRLVGTTKAILRETHYDQDIPLLADAVETLYDEYRQRVVAAGVHMAQTTRAFQDYGESRQVNLAGSDIRASASMFSVSSTAYVLESASALVNAKQMVQQSSYCHVISDLYQSFTEHSFYRSRQATHQANEITLYAESYEVAAGKSLEQYGERTVYADEMLLTVGTGSFNSQSGPLSIKASDTHIDSDRLSIRSDNFRQTANQHTVTANQLNMSSSRTTVYGNQTRVGASGVLELSGGIVRINCSRVSAPPRANTQAVTPHSPKQFTPLPDYQKNPLLPTQSARGTQLGNSQTMSPPQGTAGVYAGVSPAGTTSNLDTTTAYPDDEEPDTSINRPQL